MTVSFLGGRRIVFLGTPGPAAQILGRLLDEGFDVAEVVTGADVRRGRGGETSGSPVKQVAQAHGIPVRHHLSEVSTPWEECLGVVVAYGRMIPSSVLERTSMVNVHFSLLPRWRGAAPVERAILAGDDTTGVCIMEVVEELDAGGVFAVAEIPVGDATRDELLLSLTHLGGDLLVRVLRGERTVAVPQTGEASYARKVTPVEGLIEWSHDALSIARQVRAVRAYTWVEGRRVLVLEADVEPGRRDGVVGQCDDDAVVTCGEGLVRLRRVQPEGRSPLDAREWRRGVRGAVRLGEENA